MNNCMHTRKEYFICMAPECSADLRMCLLCYKKNHVNCDTTMLLPYKNKEQHVSVHRQLSSDHDIMKVMVENMFDAELREELKRTDRLFFDRFEMLRVNELDDALLIEDKGKVKALCVSLYKKKLDSIKTSFRTWKAEAMFGFEEFKFEFLETCRGVGMVKENYVIRYDEAMGKIQLKFKFTQNNIFFCNDTKRVIEDSN